MKKFLVIAVLIVAGVSFAFASSLKVPWYVDNAGAQANIPPAAGELSLVYLTSNATETVTCKIFYFNADGQEVGTDPADGDNTFTIAPRSSLAFRPVATDPASAPGGQEGGQGLAVPDRNTAGVDTKKNGSIVIEWVGDPNLIQGQVSQWKTQLVGQVLTVSSYAHLLPPGFSGS